MLIKIAYVAHVPGHRDSKGSAAPWVVKDHKDDHIISSHATEAEAKAHLQQMHAHSGAADKTARGAHDSGCECGFCKNKGILPGEKKEEEKDGKTKKEAAPEGFRPLGRPQEFPAARGIPEQESPGQAHMNEDFNSARLKAEEAYRDTVFPAEAELNRIRTKAEGDYKSTMAPYGRHASAKAAGIVNTIGPGDRVTILVPAGMGRNGQEWSEATGRAVMRGPAGWVLNMGGPHGSPGIAGEKNTVRVRKAKTADTADNDANEKGGKGIIHPKTDAEKPNTRGGEPELAPNKNASAKSSAKAYEASRPPLSMKKVLALTKDAVQKDPHGISHVVSNIRKTADAQMHCPQCGGVAHKPRPEDPQYRCPSCGWVSADPKAANEARLKTAAELVATEISRSLDGEEDTISAKCMMAAEKREKILRKLRPFKVADDIDGDILKEAVGELPVKVMGDEKLAAEGDINISISTDGGKSKVKSKLPPGDGPKEGQEGR